MTNTHEHITQEFNSLYSLFEDNKIQDIKKIIQTNLVNDLYSNFTKEISLVLFFESGSKGHIKISVYGKLYIALYHKCMGPEPLVYHSEISKNSTLLNSLFSSYGDKQFIHLSPDNI